MPIPKVRVRMKGSTQWLVRPNDEIHVEEKLARRWERSGLAEIMQDFEEVVAEPEITLAQLRDIASANDLAIRGTKADLIQRITNAGIPLEMPEMPEDDLPEFEEEAFEKEAFEEIKNNEEESDESELI